jgi:hypothetical protein
MHPTPARSRSIGWQGRDVHQALCVGNRAFVERSNAHGQSIDKGVEFREAERGPFQSARSVLADVQPGQALLWKYVPGRLKLIGLIKCTDMEMGFVGQADGFAGQGRPAPGAKASRRSSRRRIELGYLTFGDRILGMLKRYEDRSGCPTMLPTALAMALIHPLSTPERRCIGGPK